MSIEKLISMTFKIVLLGDSSVGKTSILYRLTHEQFIEDQVPTIGMAFFKKVIERNNMRITLEIWDTAGQEKFKKIAPIYYRNAQAVLIVYDVSRMESFRDAQRWLDEVDRYLSQDCIIYLIANKIDLEINECPKEELENLLKNKQMCYIETSAKSGHNVSRLFRRVARSLAKNKLRKMENMEQNQIIKLNEPTGNDKEQSKSQIQSCCNQ